jgi:hypothetical protein
VWAERGMCECRTWRYIQQSLGSVAVTVRKLGSLLTVMNAVFFYLCRSSPTRAQAASLVRFWWLHSLHLLGLHWSSIRPVPENSPSPHPTFTTDPRRDSNPRSKQANGRRPNIRPPVHQLRRMFLYSKTCLKRNAIVQVFFSPFSQVSVLQRVVFFFKQSTKNMIA